MQGGEESRGTSQRRSNGERRYASLRRFEVRILRYLGSSAKVVVGVVEIVERTKIAGYLKGGRGKRFFVPNFLFLPNSVTGRTIPFLGGLFKLKIFLAIGFRTCQSRLNTTHDGNNHLSSRGSTCPS